MELGKSNVDPTGTATLLTNFGSAGRHNLRAIYAPAGKQVRAVSATTPILVTVTAPTKFDRMVSLPVTPSAILDINRDGILDLLGGIPDGVTYYTPDITVHLGMGGGSLVRRLSQTWPTQPDPWATSMEMERSIS